jgi:hypothetical protein
VVSFCENKDTFQSVQNRNYCNFLFVCEELLVSQKGRTQAEDVLEEMTGEEEIVFHG